MNLERDERINIPVLPLRDVVVYPHMVIPLFVGRAKSIRCLEAAMEGNKQILLVAQKDAGTEDPGVDDLFSVGTIATVLQMLKLPDGTVKVLVEGTQRAQITTLTDNDYFTAQVSRIVSTRMDEREEDVLVRTAINQFDGYVKLNKKIPAEVLNSVTSIDDANHLADTIAAHMPLKLHDKQSVLEMRSIVDRLEFLMAMMESEIDLLQVEKRIRNRVKKQMEKSQREYYLNEQMKAIQKELGEMEDTPDEHEALRRKIEAAKMPAEAREKTEAELQKLKMMSPMSAEATVVRGYIEWMLQVPWHARSKVKKDLRQALEVLDKDHYGLERVKDRILEYLAVQSRISKIKGPILCLVGPPGVGKTSLGQSIAKATGRQYVRMALGGVRDEAEIRGHRRTYIGSMPGKLIQKMAKVGVKNPLFLLDEIDKMSSDMRGDPASALLEVLDPEQNIAFNDHYLEVDYDLSDVMFVATSNSMNIPAPLLDRMEVIRLSGYTEDEKLNIAIRHLMPKQLERNAIKKGELTVDESAIVGIIRYYTREAGVRNLEREISKLCRKAVKILILDKSLKHITITESNLKEFLGVQRFDYGRAESENRIGQVTGLAWTEVGGDLLTIETASVPGKGKLSYTGSLGEVMQESIQAALTVVRARYEGLGINGDFYEKRDIHVHVPEGATPKDGPSAGTAMCTALVSSLTGNPVRSDVAMTGEITLRGLVLPIGGLKEKLLAAHRGGIKIVLIPEENVRDLEDIPDNVKADLDIYPVKRIDEVLQIALVNPPFGAQSINLPEPIRTVAAKTETKEIKQDSNTKAVKPTAKAKPVKTKDIKITADMKTTTKAATDVKAKKPAAKASIKPKTAAKAKTETPAAKVKAQADAKPKTAAKTIVGKATVAKATVAKTTVQAKTEKTATKVKAQTDIKPKAAAKTTVGKATVAKTAVAKTTVQAKTEKPTAKVKAQADTKPKAAAKTIVAKTTVAKTTVAKATVAKATVAKTTVQAKTEKPAAKVKAQADTKPKAAAKTIVAKTTVAKTTVQAKTEKPAAKVKAQADTKPKAAAKTTVAKTTVAKTTVQAKTEKPATKVKVQADAKPKAAAKTIVSKTTVAKSTVAKSTVKAKTEKPAAKVNAKPTAAKTTADVKVEKPLTKVKVVKAKIVKAKGEAKPKAATKAKK